MVVGIIRGEGPLPLLADQAFFFFFFLFRRPPLSRAVAFGSLFSNPSCRRLPRASRADIRVAVGNVD